MTKQRWTFYSDGACSGNPGPGAWAYVSVQKEGQQASGFDPQTTNNRMEMLAVINIMLHCPPDQPLEIVTDSKYLKDGYNQWLPNWKARGWRTASNKPVKNQDLWQQLDELAKGRDINWRWVKGHAGEAHNEKVDQLAQSTMCQGMAQGMAQGMVQGMAQNTAKAVDPATEPE